MSISFLSHFFNEVWSEKSSISLKVKVRRWYFQHELCLNYFSFWIIINGLFWFWNWQVWVWHPVFFCFLAGHYLESAWHMAPSCTSEKLCPCPLDLHECSGKNWTQLDKLHMPESTIESRNDRQIVKIEIVSKLLFLLVFGTLTQYFFYKQNICPFVW